MASSFDRVTNLHRVNEDGRNGESWHTAMDNTVHPEYNHLSFLPIFTDETISVLVEKESDHMPQQDYLQRFRNRNLDPSARRDAISWIVKVHSLYNFGVLTAYLAINYMDRFLSAHRMPQGIRAWTIQLLSVACLSLAAKMEDTHIPSLMDLQRLDARFIFDIRTVQRMELVVLSTLKWRMRSITPFYFIEYFVSKVETDNLPPKALIARATELILGTHKGIDFLEHRPSVIAAAAVLCASEEVAPLRAAHYKRAISSCVYVDKERMFSCYNLFQDIITDRAWRPRKTICESESTAKTPVGVLDVGCLSSGSEKSKGPPTSSSIAVSYASVAAKRRKLNDFCSASFMSEIQHCWTMEKGPSF